MTTQIQTGNPNKQGVRSKLAQICVLQHTYGIIKYHAGYTYHTCKTDKVANVT